MWGKKNNIHWLVITAFLFADLYFLLFSHQGIFLFKADYQDIKLWYPYYYNEVYALNQFFKIGFCLSLIYFLWKFWFYFKQGSKTLFEFIQSEKKALINPTFKKKYYCNYRDYFWKGEILLLVLVLIIYYSNKYLGMYSVFNIQLYLSRLYILAALNGLILFGWVNRKYFISELVKFLFNPVTPYNLAIYRIIFFLILAKTYETYSISKIQYIEIKPREALPFIGWLIDIMPISKDIYFYACTIGIICCIFLLFGLFTRFFLFANAVLVFYIISVPNFYGKLWHSQLPIWISWFMLFAPVSDVYSLDKLFFKRNESLVKSPDYNFPIKIIWLQIGFIYFWTGFHKLGDAGFDWALSQSMINQVRLEWFEHFDKLPFYRIDQNPLLLYISGIIVIFFELNFWVFLFHHRLKYLSILGGLLMHNLIGVFMYISFEALQVQYVVFINYEKLLLCLKRIIIIIPVKENFEKLKITVNKKLVIFSLIIFSLNFLFGLFQINSFPFSVYPSYSEIIESEKEYLHYVILDNDKKNIDIWKLAKQSDFRWEDFTRLEYAIIKKYHDQKIIDTLAIEKQWKWWANHLPELKSADTIDVYIYKRSLNPDLAKVILDKHYLFRFCTNEQ